MVVEIEDVWDEFNHGIANPEATRAFLTHARKSWRRSPRYLLLAGAGTYDYKDYLGCGGNLVPPVLVSTRYGLFASDGWLGDVDGDGVEDLAVGRIPARTAQELRAVAAKIRRYETSPTSPVRRVVLAADDPDDGGDFPADSEALAELLPEGCAAARAYLSELGLEAARARLLGEMRGGAFLVNYLGHAGLDRLAQEGLLTADDAVALAGIERPPVLSAMTCVAGRFEVPGHRSLGETLALWPTGGAVAVWAPSGLAMNADSKRLARELFRCVLEPSAETLGGALRTARRACGRGGGSLEVLSIYNLLGDPALALDSGAAAKRCPAGHRLERTRGGGGDVRERGQNR